MSRPLAIAVDPEKRKDMYYRYTMPPVETKIEGSGNGIKTVFPNILDVCSSINRPSEVVMKFFQFECGAQRTVSRDQKCWLMGQFQEDRIQKVLDDFVTKYVLCDKCRSPETNYTLENKNLTSHCDACGRSRQLKNVHKVDTFMLSYYNAHKDALNKKITSPAGAGAGAGAGAAAAAAAGAAEEPAAPAAVEPSPAVRETAKAREDDKKAPPVKDTTESPIDVTLATFQKLRKSHPGQIEYHKEILSTQVRQILLRYCLPDHAGVSILVLMFAKAYPDKLCEAVHTYHSLIKVFTNATEMAIQKASGSESEMENLRKSEAKTRVEVLEELAKIFYNQSLVDNHYFNLDQLVKVVFVFYMEGIVDASNIEKWMANPFIIQPTPPETTQLLAKMGPIADWLGI
eukprot:gene11977-8250_t